MKNSIKFNIKDITPQKISSITKFSVCLIVLAFIRALFTYVFIIPNGFAPGGLSGVSSIIYNAILPFNPNLAETIFNPAVTGFVLNIPLFIISFFLLNKRFAINTFFCVAIYSAFMGLFSAVDFPQYLSTGSENSISLLAALASGAGCGLSLGLMLKFNMSMGGTDVIGKAIYRFNSSTDVQWWIFICDIFVVLGSGALGFIGMDSTLGATAILTAILSPVLYSFISLLVTSQVADVVQAGMQSSLIFNIISEQHDDISKKITSTLHRGVTILKGVGYYTQKEHEVLICVVSKRQINNVKNIIMEFDPSAFVYITKASEVSGNGFKPKSFS